MRWTIVLLALFLSGCVATYSARYQSPPPLQTTSLAQVDAMVGGQQPVAYRVGFRDGCDSGRVSAGNTSFIFKKDVTRFDEDSLYQQGWTDGYNRCYAEGPVYGGTAVTTTYGYGYYPGYFYSGFYYPAWGYYSYYDPGYSIWLGVYGHRHYYRPYDRYYYTPWYGGFKHRHKGSYNRYSGGTYLQKRPYYGSGSYKGGGGPYLQPRSGYGSGIYKGGVGPYIQRSPGRSGGYKGGHYKGGGFKGGGHRGGGPKGRGGWR